MTDCSLTRTHIPSIVLLSVPPPPSSIRKRIYDCSNVKDVHGIENEIPTHRGYHYSSTAVEWYKVLGAIKSYDASGRWTPDVSLRDGLAAVLIGLQATQVIINEQDNDEVDPLCHARSMEV
jgi:hypothetical protein